MNLLLLSAGAAGSWCLPEEIHSCSAVFGKGVFCLAKQGKERWEIPAQLSSMQDEKTVLHNVCTDIHSKLNGAYGVSRL